MAKKSGSPTDKRASFCIPKVALDALIAERADARTICAYLALACGTEESGRFSTWGETAIKKRMGGRPDLIRQSIERLSKITAKDSSVKGKKERPLVYSRSAWLKEVGGEALPDGPIERAKILHVLPDFGEALDERVWISAELVHGIGTFKKPLAALRDCGDVAARMLLVIYKNLDMEGWGGLPPINNAHVTYDTCLDERHDGYRIIHGKERSKTANLDLFSKAVGNPGFAWKDEHEEKSAWDALDALVSGGLIYEIVTAINRNPEKSKYSTGNEYGGIPGDAEPLYELDCKSKHGYKPKGEEGLGGLTARIAHAMGYSVADGGVFHEKYAAIVPAGWPVMIAGIYRPRFRVSNPKNKGVKYTWSRIHEGNQKAIQWLRLACRKYGIEAPELADTDSSRGSKPSDMDQELRQQACAVLDFMGEKTLSDCTHVEENLAPIVERLREGATVDVCKQIIDKAYTSTQFLVAGPVDLFSKEKFDQMMSRMYPYG